MSVKRTWVFLIVSAVLFQEKVSLNLLSIISPRHLNFCTIVISLLLILFMHNGFKSFFLFCHMKFNPVIFSKFIIWFLAYSILFIKRAKLSANRRQFVLFFTFADIYILWIFFKPFFLMMKSRAVLNNKGESLLLIQFIW